MFCKHQLGLVLILLPSSCVLCVHVCFLIYNVDHIHSCVFGLLQVFIPLWLVDGVIVLFVLVVWHCTIVQATLNHHPVAFLIVLSVATGQLFLAPWRCSKRFWLVMLHSLISSAMLPMTFLCAFQK